jgi:NAD(P)-dependent dehydrogenase (short-subunit alcohol dehydrogenase family)
MAQRNPSAGEVGDLRGRRAIVTGGGRGIGQAIAEELASRGVFVHVVSQSKTAELVANDISNRGGDAVAHIGSVADSDFSHSVVALTEEAGGADVLVNAAAILGPTGPFESISSDGFSEVIAVNLLGTSNFMRAALPGMTARRFGRIINFAGGGAAYSYPRFSPYAASKVAVVRLTETVADEISVPNVTVNVIAPGAVATDMLGEVRRGGGEIRTTVAIEEPVRLVLFLAGNESSHVNGRFIHVRDPYLDPELFVRDDMLKLRRVELR